MYEDEEIEYVEAELPKEALIAEQLLISEIEADAKEKPIEDDDEDEQPERKLLKRELRAQALARLEDSARTVTDFKNVAAWWDRLDANRERRERYHEILRSNDDIPLEYGASFDARCFPNALNSMLEKQNRRGDFLDAIFCCPYEINELVTEEYISDILYGLNEEQKFLLFLYAVRQYSSTRIASIKGQSDRNIRKVRATMLNKIQKKLLVALDEKVQKQQPLTLLEKNFLTEKDIKIDNEK
ncbi:MAG: hypothetical protein K2H23_04270 [Oscillospiraceae bacterium]|nr:hypothetical protein [Oscillospiraceae bacterium]